MYLSTGFFPQPTDCRDADSLGADFHELSDSLLGVRLDTLEELEGVVGVPVDNVHAFTNIKSYF